MIGIKIKAILTAPVLCLSALVVAAAIPSHAFAFSPSLGDAMENVIYSSSDIPDLLSAFAYICGLGLAVMAIFKLKDHVINPNQTPLSDSVKRFLAGGAFFALPRVVVAAQSLITGGGFGGFIGSLFGAVSGEFNVTPGYGDAGGLDEIMVNMMADLWPAVNDLVAAFCYLAGIVFVMIGISRLLKTAQEGPRGPAGFGTMMTFLVGGILLSFDTLLGSFSESLFGLGGDLNTYAELSFSDGSMDMTHVNNVIAAMMAFMIIVGLISFIRGWFILRSVAEGNHQASFMAGMTHIFGGALAVNLGPVLNAVQTTFGLTGYGITFS